MTELERAVLEVIARMRIWQCANLFDSVNTSKALNGWVDSVEYLSIVLSGEVDDE